MTTLGNDPGFINSSGGAPAYDAADLRLLDSVDLLSDGSALGSRPGVRPSSVEGLEPSVSGGTYTVSPGLAVISKDVDGALGAYRVALSQAVVESVPAADSVNARKDVIYLRVFDTDVDGLGLREGQVVYEEGTPSVTPVEPTVPADALFLASVDVPAAGQGNPTLQDRRVYTVASGGVLPTGVYPTDPYVGQTVFREDTDTLEVFTSSGWRKAYLEDGWSGGVPVLQGYPYYDSSGTSSTLRGGVAVVNVNVTCTALASPGDPIFRLPAGHWPALDPLFVDVIDGNTAQGPTVRLHVESDGEVRIQPSVPSGTVLRGSFTVPVA